MGVVIVVVVVGSGYLFNCLTDSSNFGALLKGWGLVLGTRYLVLIVVVDVIVVGLGASP